MCAIPEEPGGIGGQEGELHPAVAILVFRHHGAGTIVAGDGHGMSHGAECPLMPCLKLLPEQSVPAKLHAPVGILFHLLRPVADGHCQAVKAVVVGKASPVTGQPGHLVEELVLEGRLDRHVPCGMKIPFDDGPADN